MLAQVVRSTLSFSLCMSQSYGAYGPIEYCMRKQIPEHELFKDQKKNEQLLHNKRMRIVLMRDRYYMLACFCFMLALECLWYVCVSWIEEEEKEAKFMIHLHTDCAAINRRAERSRKCENPKQKRKRRVLGFYGERCNLVSSHVLRFAFNLIEVFHCKFPI